MLCLHQLLYCVCSAVLLDLLLCCAVLYCLQGLSDHHDNYHEFCRLLGRLKSNYQLSELVSAPKPLTPDP
jgi:hypothetical protein